MPSIVTKEMKTAIRLVGKSTREPAGTVAWKKRAVLCCPIPRMVTFPDDRIVLFGYPSTILPERHQTYGFPVRNDSLINGSIVVQECTVGFVLSNAACIWTDKDRAVRECVVVLSAARLLVVEV